MKYYREDLVVDAWQFNGQEMPDLLVNRTEGNIEVEVGGINWALLPGQALLTVDRSLNPYNTIILNPGQWCITHGSGMVQRLHPTAFAEFYRPVELDGETSDGYHTFNELYEHRHHLWAWILSDYRYMAFKTRKTADGRETPGWFIAVLETGLGQMSYRMPEVWWERMPWLAERAMNDGYDGHVPADVLVRMLELALDNPLYNAEDAGVRLGIG